MKHRMIPTRDILGILCLLIGSSANLSAAPPQPTPPDFTQGGKKDDTHDWLLGPTGMRGWVFFQRADQTAKSRQILVTQVETGSPADGVLRTNDVILGVNGKPFADDARKTFGKAVTAAEEKSGVLHVTRWRDGQTAEVDLKLPALGAYSDTAPYNCPKSKAIFEQGCRLIAKNGLKNVDIPIELNALALLASGNKEYHPLLKDYAKKVAASLQPDTWNWHYAYGNLFLSEYALATGDKSIMPELKRTTMAAVKAQCMNGMWGHAPALPNGHSEGYGGMNQIGAPMTIALVLARQAGVSDPALDKAIDKSVTMLRYFVNKGAIPYGDHLPGANVHDDNGKTSCAAVLFDLLGDREASSFYSWMATAAYDEREHGHCGNFWNMLWALPGASRSGPLATGAYLKEQSWYYDLARNWKGGFVYQEIEFPAEENKNYTDWDLTGGYMLSFGLPEKSLFLIGKKPSIVQPLKADAVKNIIAAGRDFYPDGDGNGYHTRKTEELLAGLTSWSPALRFRSAQELGKRGDGNNLPTLLTMLAGKDRYARYGAIEALGRLGPHAESAAPQLRAVLKDPDIWMQWLASEALARIGGKAAKESIGDLFAMILHTTPADLRRMHQRVAAMALFSPYPGNSEPASIISGSLDGVDRQQLYPVIRALLLNEDSVVRASLNPILPKLTDHDLAVLLPDIVRAVETVAPTNEMWSDDIRQAGLDLLSRRHIREGMLLCVSTIEWRWGVDLQKRLEFLSRYGKNAREVLPQLNDILKDLESKEHGHRESDGQKALRKSIANIESSNDAPALDTLKQFIETASKAK